MSRIRSPGRLHRQPSSCWCSVYCSRRSWNTTRMMLWEGRQAGDWLSVAAKGDSRGTHLYLLSQGTSPCPSRPLFLVLPSQLCSPSAAPQNPNHTNSKNSDDCPFVHDY